MKKNSKIVILIIICAYISVGVTWAEAFPAHFNLTDLNGKNGFAVNGDSDDFIGISISNADINGDGIADLLIGTALMSKSYVVFGTREPRSSKFNVTNLNGTNGFIVRGDNLNGEEGATRVSGIGDVNGDGIDDLLISVVSLDDVGQSYVLFGNKNIWPQELNLDDLNGENGFTIVAIGIDDGSGFSASGVGDVNGDGVDDFLIGAPSANKKTGQSYTIFGRKEQWPAVIQLVNLDGNNGFAINGIHPNDWSGVFVSGAGDINGDGIDDMLIGASRADYVIFGRKENWPTAISLADLNGTNGFAISINSKEGSGSFAMKGAGDINGDGINDIIIGTLAFGDSKLSQGYVVFGSNNTWFSAINLTDLNGSNGFAVKGTEGGYSVSGAGDINGDGIDDFLMGNPGKNLAGQTYMVFGSNKSWPPVIKLISLNSKNGFTINGIHPKDDSGYSVSDARDINGDGIDDFLIGAPRALNNTGQVYIIFGGNGLN